MSYLCPTASDTENLGQRLAAQAGAGSVYSLRGPLGAGKTTLVRGFLRHFGHSAISSPSYTLAQTYPTAPPVHHLDFYRLEDAEEVDELGLSDYFVSNGICLVEWGDRFPALLPEHAITVSIAVEASGVRRVFVE